MLTPLILVLGVFLAFMIGELHRWFVNREMKCVNERLLARFEREALLPTVTYIEAETLVDHLTPYRHFDEFERFKLINEMIAYPSRYVELQKELNDLRDKAHAKAQKSREHHDIADAVSKSVMSENAKFAYLCGLGYTVKEALMLCKLTYSCENVYTDEVAVRFADGSGTIISRESFYE